MKIQHQLDNNSTYSCSETNCFRDFVGLKTFENHLKSKHSTDFQSYTVLNKSVPKKSSDFSFESNEHELTTNIDFNFASIITDFKTMLEKETIAFVAKLYDNPSLPRNCVQDMIDQFNLYLSSGFIQLLEYVTDTLKKLNISSDTSNNITLMFKYLADPLSSLKTEYLRHKQFEMSNCLIKPQEIIIGQRQSPCKIDNAVSLILWM